MVGDSEHLPTRAEIADKRALDGGSAIGHFYGKTVAEAVELFAAALNPLTYTEDLLWMRPVGFRFYIRAAIQYALSDRANGQPDLINGIAGTLASRHERHPRELTPCAGFLAEFCRAVVEQFDRYDADPEIYVGLREQYQQLAEIFTNMAKKHANASSGRLRRRSWSQRW